MSWILSLLGGFSLRQYAIAAGIAAALVFVLIWDHREIQKGRDQCEARYAAAEADAKKKQLELQAKLDAQAAAHDAAIKAVIGSPVTKPSGCVLTKELLLSLQAKP